MTVLELTDEERIALAELLEGAVSDLSMEIADTDRLAYREQIRHRREVLRVVAGKVGATTVETDG